MDQKQEEEKSSQEAAMASSPLQHPCSLLQYIARACACCLGLRDSFSTPPKEPEPSTSLTPLITPAQEGEEGKKPNYVYVEEDVVIIQERAIRTRRSNPKGPGNPREGRGGGGGEHN